MTKTDDNPAFPTLGWEQIDGLTARQYAAIHLCVPRSGDDWLDDMIREARRDRFAMSALTGLLGGRYSETTVYNLSEVPEEADRIADAMMKERE